MILDRTQWRSYILRITGAGIYLALLYAVFVPTAGNRQVAKFNFPDRFTTAQAIANQNKMLTSSLNKEENPEKIEASQLYQYRHNGQAIALQINYLISTRGDVGTYLSNYTEIDSAVIKARKIKQIAGVGYHALLSDNQQAYLTSCISPRSLSNVNQKQFSRNRYQNDLNWQTGIQWLQGKASLRDRRCLWVLLALPQTSNQIQADYQILEAAWQDIYHWWLPNFPDLVAH